MDVLDLLSSHRSIRTFKPDAIDEALLKTSCRSLACFIQNYPNKRKAGQASKTRLNFLTFMQI